MDPTGLVGKGAEYGATVAYEKLKNWIGLVSDYNQNLQNAKDLREDLDEKLKETQEIVEVQERNNQVVIHDVKKWIHNVESFLRSSDENANKKDWEELLIDEDVRKKADRYCFSFVGWNPKYRHHISRVAKEKIAEMEQWQKKINESGSNLTRPLLQPGLPFNDGDYYEGLKSRENKLEEIMVALQNDNVNRIGIYGMGGAGKTTLVEEIARRTENAKLFNEIILVEISKDPNIKLIQNRIADRIGFHALHTIHAVEERAMGLYKCLKKLKEKDSRGLGGTGQGGKLLVILDNLWDKLPLHLLGIYSELENDMGCKIIITSRSLQVCRMMDVTTYMFHIGDLDHEEATQLFKKRVGLDVFEREDYKDLASQVLQLCPCLPLSINLLASMLKNQPLYVWKDAIKELENPIVGNIGGRVLHGTYAVVKMSYKYIKDEDPKRFFLLCCLFPPGASIKIKDLLIYGIGLGLFQYVYSFEEAQSQTRKWLDNLKSLSLILEVNMFTGEITIHDDVREAGKFFEDQGEFIFHVGDIPRWLEIETRRRYIAISTTASDSNYNQLTELDLPRLQLLRILGNGPSILWDGYFSGMQNVKVLDLSNIEFEALPISIEQLSNLRTLLIENCSVKDISRLAKLTKLRVLSLRGCYALMKLPQEIGNLGSLKLLDLTNCVKLQEIPAHTLEKLTQLEGLYMMGSFTSWQVEGSLSSIDELKSLTLLQVLEVQIRCVKHLPQGNFPTLNLTSYKIDFGSNFSQHILLEKDLSFSRDLQVSQVDACELMKEGWKTLFEKSERLLLAHIQNFEKITHDTLFLFNLQVLKLVGLTGPQYALPSQSARKLKVLEVSHCADLKYIFYTPGALQGANASLDEDDEEIQFPCLQDIYLFALPSLESFCFTKRDEITTEDEASKNKKSLFRKKTIFGSLKKLILDSLNIVEELWDTTAGDEFPNVFSNLEDIRISSMPKLKYVWGDHTINLQCMKLKKLDVRDCNCMESVCKIRSHTSKELLTLTCFPKLTSLRLCRLDGLTCFYRGKVNMEFPALESLKMKYLTNFETFRKLAQDTEEYDDGGDGDVEYSNGNRGGGIQTKALFSNGKVLLPSLKNLTLNTLDQIETVWTTKYTSQEEGCVMRFPKLEVLSLMNMANLRVIWQWSSTRDHEIGCIEAPLRELSLLYLPMLEGLVEVQMYECHGNNDEVDNIITASTEERGHLLNTNTATSMKERNRPLAKDTKALLFNGNVVLSSSLIDVYLIRLDKIETIWDIGVSDEKVDFANGFPEMNTLHISDLPKLKSIWTGDRSEPGIKFPPEWLWLEKLPAFEGLAKVETPDQEERCNVGALFNVKQVIFPQLERLNVGALGNIDRIWDATFREVKCPKLAKLDIYKMPKLRHISIGPICNLASLTNMKIQSCQVMESLVNLPLTESSVDARDQEIHQDKIRVLNFQALLVLDLRDLPLIQVLFKIDNIIDTASGEEVDRDTEELKTTKRTFLSGEFKFPSLETLRVRHMPQLEDVFDDSTTVARCGTLLFPKLNLLHLSHSPLLKGETAILTNLSKIYVEGFTGLRCLFSSSSNNSSLDNGLFPITVLKNLQELFVEDCSSLEELFEVGSDGATVVSIPPAEMLRELNLIKLQKLKQVPFWMLPNLQSVKINNCFHESETWLLASVHRMVEAPMLQKLEKLKIENCDGLEAVIADEKTLQLVHDNLEQPNIVNLPLLKTVKIRSCTSLYAFSSANYSVVLPSLESIVISQSMNMRRFTSRSLVAPRLSNVDLDGEEIKVDEDFDTIRLRQMKENCKVIKKWPKTLKHMLHKEHELKLTSRTRDFFCNKCSKLIGGYTYSCTLCDFDLHSACALNENELTEQPRELEAAQDWPRTLQHKLHTAHQLHLVMGRLYTCDACKQKGLELFSFSCDSCSFNLHPKCALDEVLSLKESDEEDDEEDTRNLELLLTHHVGYSSENLVSSTVTDSSTSGAPGVPFSVDRKFVDLQSSEVHDILNPEMQEAMTHVPSTVKKELINDEVLPSASDLPEVNLKASNISTVVTQEDPISSLVVPLLQQLLTTNVQLLTSINALLVEMNKKQDTTPSDKTPSSSAHCPSSSDHYESL